MMLSRSRSRPRPRAEPFPHVASASGPPALAGRECGTGPPLVLVHGLASSSRYWGDRLPFVSAHRVLAPDLLGFGRSPKPASAGYTSAEHVTALRAALRARTAGPFDLVGHSLGTLIALHYAAAFPEDVRSLVLISLPVVGGCAWGHGPDGGTRGWHRWSVHTDTGTAVMDAAMTAARPMWHLIAPVVRRDLPPAAARDALAGTWHSYWRTLEAVVYGTDVVALLDRVRAPVRVVHGDRDRVTPVRPVRQLVAATPRISYQEIAGAGHNPYVSHRRDTIAAIAPALARVT
jgi:cis-3-alkyl-4-acyloxetan-2-one decarboxylase